MSAAVGAAMAPPRGAERAYGKGDAALRIVPNDCAGGAGRCIVYINHYAGGPTTAWSTGRTTWRASG